MAGYQICQGCGTSYPPGQEDLYVRHVERCEFVDGAGNPRTATCLRCGRQIEPDHDADPVAWVHSDDDEPLCRPDDADSPHAVQQW
jgi:ribosomal protein L24E